MTDGNWVLKEALKLHTNKRRYMEHLVYPPWKLVRLQILSETDNQGDRHPTSSSAATHMSISSCQQVSADARDNKDSIWFLKI